MPLDVPADPAEVAVVSVEAVPVEAAPAGAVVVEAPPLGEGLVVGGGVVVAVDVDGVVVVLGDVLVVEPAGGGLVGVVVVDEAPVVVLAEVGAGVDVPVDEVLVPEVGSVLVDDVPVADVGAVPAGAAAVALAEAPVALGSDGDAAPPVLEAPGSPVAVVDPVSLVPAPAAPVVEGTVDVVPVVLEPDVGVVTVVSSDDDPAGAAPVAVVAPLPAVVVVPLPVWELEEVAVDPAVVVEVAGAEGVVDTVEAVVPGAAA